MSALLSDRTLIGRTGRDLGQVGVMLVVATSEGEQRFDSYLGCACCGEPVAPAARRCFDCDDAGVCRSCGQRFEVGLSTAWFTPLVDVLDDGRLRVSDGGGDATVVAGWAAWSARADLAR